MTGYNPFWILDLSPNNSLLVIIHTLDWEGERQVIFLNDHHSRKITIDLVLLVLIKPVKIAHTKKHSTRQCARKVQTSFHELVFQHPNQIPQTIPYPFPVIENKLITKTIKDINFPNKLGFEEKASWWWWQCGSITQCIAITDLIINTNN